MTTDNPVRFDAEGRQGYALGKPKIVARFGDGVFEVVDGEWVRIRDIAASETMRGQGERWQA